MIIDLIESIMEGIFMDLGASIDNFTSGSTKNHIYQVPTTYEKYDSEEYELEEYELKDYKLKDYKIKKYVPEDCPYCSKLEEFLKENRKWRE